MQRTVKAYVVGILIPLAVGVLSALLTRGNMMIYDEIARPPLAPPAILFPIVWTVLYVLMGIGSARVWLKKEEKPLLVTNALAIYALQLFFNFFWSILFFNMRAFFAAFLWLVVLWILILLMIVKFLKIDFVGGIINIPYILWVTFAGYLNIAIALMN